MSKYLKRVFYFFKINKMKKCLYCNSEILDESVVEFCETCGKRVWGSKMLKAIIENMKEAKEKGNL